MMSSAKENIMEVKVGDRFEHTWSAKWVDGADGGNHFRRTTIEVTAVDKYNAEYKDVEVLEESGLPTWCAPKQLFSGGFAVRFVVDGSNKSLRRI